MELLQAEACIALEQYNKAKFHLKQAALMCPIRFIPLYRLHYVLEKQGNRKEAEQLAHTIIRKPVKINSKIVKRIKKEMKVKIEK